MGCKHTEFDGLVKVTRIVADHEEKIGEHVEAMSYAVDLSISCRTCGEKLLFRGLPTGLVVNGAAVSLDHTEARLYAIAESKLKH